MALKLVAQPSGWNELSLGDALRAEMSEVALVFQERFLGSQFLRTDTTNYLQTLKSCVSIYIYISFTR